MSVTARSVLSSALVGENPYIAAERVIEKLDAAGWEIVRKPRIPEPGLWGVVEAIDASDQSRMPRMFLRDAVDDEDPHWVVVGGNVRVEWDDLIDPVLVREGVA